MSKKAKKFVDNSSIEFLLLREKLGLKRYRKTRIRDQEKKKILYKLAIKKIEDKESNDFIKIDYRRRKLNMS